ncbi:kinase-like protein [Peniophora sp. CONT]|nr:kinase-like protein [Peniophora sp. CONT]
MAHNSHIYRLYSFARLEPLRSDISCFAPDCSTAYQGSVYLHDRLDQWVIGRGKPGKPCDVPLLDDKNAASSIHAIIYYVRRRDGGTRVYLKSVSVNSSTWVNGKVLEKDEMVELSHLDEIWCGYIDGRTSAGIRFVNLFVSRPYLRDHVFEVTLGSGAFGEVHKIHKRAAPQSKLAVKVLDFGRRGGISRYDAASEVAIVKELLNHDHQHIVPLSQVFGDEDHSQMYVYTMEFLPQGDLSHVLEAREHFASLDEILTIMNQQLSALSYLHNMGIIHRDVKFLNILVKSSSPWWTLLADFGTAKRISRKPCRGYEVTKSVVGTRHYVAPEVVLDPMGHGPLADSYSAGVVMFLMLQGELSLTPYRFSRPPTTFREHVLYRTLAWDRLDHRKLGITAKGRKVLRLLQGLVITDLADRLSISEALSFLKAAPIIRPHDLKGNETQPGVSPSLRRLQAALVSAAGDVVPIQGTPNVRESAYRDERQPMPPTQVKALLIDNSTSQLVQAARVKPIPRPRNINRKFRTPEQCVAQQPAQNPEPPVHVPLPLTVDSENVERPVQRTGLETPVRRSPRLNRAG